jgi:hypothetical protein
LREALANDPIGATVDLFGFAGERCDRIVENVMTTLPESPERRGGPVPLRRKPPPKEQS